MALRRGGRNAPPGSGLLSFCPKLFRLQLHQDSSYTSHVPGNGGWRDRSPVERRGLGCPLGSLRAAEGGKSGINVGFGALVYSWHAWRGLSVYRESALKLRTSNCGSNAPALCYCSDAEKIKVAHLPTTPALNSPPSLPRDLSVFLEFFVENFREMGRLEMPPCAAKQRGYLIFVGASEGPTVS